VRQCIPRRSDRQVASGQLCRRLVTDDARLRSTFSQLRSSFTAVILREDLRVYRAAAQVLRSIIVHLSPVYSTLLHLTLLPKHFIKIS